MVCVLVISYKWGDHHVTLCPTLEYLYKCIGDLEEDAELEHLPHTLEDINEHLDTNNTFFYQYQNSTYIIVQEIDSMELIYKKANLKDVFLPKIMEEMEENYPRKRKNLRERAEKFWEWWDKHLARFIHDSLDSYEE